MEPGDKPGGERETVSRPDAGRDYPRGGWGMYENDCEIDVPTADELLAEIGLDAYTIRVIRDEAKGEREEFCSV